MKTRKSHRGSKVERTAENKRMISYHQHGDGLFLFRNRSQSATISLPKESSDGRRTVGAYNPNVPGSGEWEGDSYFFELVPRDAILVKTIRPPGETLMENKLILDQPDQVTNAGPVEHVASEDLPLNENPEEGVEKEGAEVLLTEDPLEGVTIINE